MFNELCIILAIVSVVVYIAYLVMVKNPLPQYINNPVTITINHGLQLDKMYVARMTTSRTDNTKYEYFVMQKNSAGNTQSLFMFYDPQKALFTAMQQAKFCGVPCDDLYVDGVKIELDEISKMMLED